MPEITIKLGDQTLQTLKFDGDVLRIGRSRENDVVLENLSVSRDHAQIRLHDGTYILTDLNSANGTLVNGVRITKTEVVHEDIITVGKHKLHFRNPVLVVAGDGDDVPDAVRTVLVEPKAEAWLVVESGRLKDREFRITRFETSLGKAATNDIVLTDDWLLAKKQAIILRKGNNAFEIQDMGGLRKVKVNGKAVNEKADIKDSDVIEMGGTKLRFRSSATQTTPTGRVPQEISSDGDVHEAKREAGRLDGMRRHEQPARPVAPDAIAAESISEDSMDLEEGFQSIRMSIVGDSGTAPAIPARDKATDNHEAVKSEDYHENGASEASAKNDVSEQDDSLPTPLVPVESIAAISTNGVSSAAQNGSHAENNNEKQPQAAAKPAEVSTSRPQQHQPFEDKRSSTRRRRKHHQRAAQKQNDAAVSSSSRQKSASPSQAQKAAAEVRQHSELTSEKEIAMWENALKNPSPAIQKQAVRMLKKLTGKDYEV